MIINYKIKSYDDYINPIEIIINIIYNNNKWI